MKTMKTMKTGDDLVKQAWYYGLLLVEGCPGTPSCLGRC